MISETDGVILSRVRMPDDRTMLVLFTRKYGKISAGTGIRLNGKNKSSLALRVFTHGRYELFFGANTCNVNTAETINSFFRISEDVDKYMTASYILEYTNRLLPEGQPNEQLFDMLIDLLGMIERRKQKMSTLTLVYQIKSLECCGYFPRIERCVSCGAPLGEDFIFSVADGGGLCKKCINKIKPDKHLIYDMKFDIIRALKSIQNNNIRRFEKLALSDDIYCRLNEITKAYMSYHIGIDRLKSENYLV